MSRSRSATPPPAPPAPPTAPAPPPAPPAPIAGVPVVVGTEVVKPDGAAKADTQQLDLVFTMDCTGSMGSYIHAAKKNIEAIAAKLAQSEGYDLRFALVAYRDHPPQDQTYVTKQFAFTNDVEQMKRDLATLSAQGGGDGPEAVAAGLKATLDSAWRPNATKVCVLIADAPPHGLGENGDGFPNGAPDGVDPFAVLGEMSMKGICIYSVGCEPALSSYNFARDFFVAAAQKTNGQAVSLRSAAALADVIMGGAIEEMDLQQLADEVVAEVRQMREARGGGSAAAEEGYDSEEERATAWSAIQSRGHRTRHMETKKLKSKVAFAVGKASSLAEARETLKSVAPPRAPRSFAASRSRGARCEMPMLGSMRASAAAEGLMMAAAAPAKAGKKKSLGAGAFLFRSASPVLTCDAVDEPMDELEGASLERRMSDSGDEYSDRGSDGSDDEEAAASVRTGGVRLETRALSFSQMSRIYGRQKKMGVL